MHRDLDKEELKYLRELWSEQAHRGVEPPAVLVIDDDTEFLDELVVLIGDEGLRCYTAGSSAAALAMLRDHAAIRVLIVDLKMPGMDGLELIRAVKQEYGDRCSCMMVSAHGRMADVQEAMHEEVLEFVTKPLDIGLFLDRFRRVMWVATERSKEPQIHSG